MKSKKERRNRSRFLGITFKHPILGIIQPKLLHSRSEPTEWDNHNNHLNPAFVQLMNEAAKQTPADLRECFETLVPQSVSIVPVQQQLPNEILRSDMRNIGDSDEIDLDEFFVSEFQFDPDFDFDFNFNFEQNDCVSSNDRMFPTSGH
jgi:hypothetical protein